MLPFLKWSFGKVRIPARLALCALSLRGGEADEAISESGIAAPRCAGLAMTVLLASLVLAPAAGFAQTSGLPKARGSYWASGGTNLVEEKRGLIPFLEQKELFQLLSQNGKVIFLDIREPHEFQKSHIPGARNISFTNRHDFFSKFNSEDQTTYIPYCNWDFRGYVAARELKEKGIQNIMMMYPHGLRGWIGSGLPAAGEESGANDEVALAKLGRIAQERHCEGAPLYEGSKQHERPKQSNSLLLRGNDPNGAEAISDTKIATPATGGLAMTGVRKHITMLLLPKTIEPTHVKASVGDHLVIDLVAEGEDHWFVMPDFDVDFHLKQGEHKTIEFDITKPGYFPFGCITCCVKYQCKIKQAVLVDLKEPVSYYGEQ